MNNNPLNDSIESEVPREEAHTIKLNKKKVVVAGVSLLNGISEKGLSRDHRLKIFPVEPDCIIILAGTNDITNGIISLN